jgi:hypothetical protein
MVPWIKSLVSVLPICSNEIHKPSREWQSCWQLIWICYRKSTGLRMAASTALIEQCVTWHIIACPFTFLNWSSFEEKLNNYDGARQDLFGHVTVQSNGRSDLWFKGTKCAHQIFPACNLTLYIGHSNCNFLLILDYFFRALEPCCGYTWSR